MAVTVHVYCVGSVMFDDMSYQRNEKCEHQVSVSASAEYVKWKLPF